jgi:tRNA(fMet)-specific endonuclease VapC
MLDTNICIYIIKNKPESVIKHLKAKQSDGLAISVITLAELEHGVAASAFPEKNALALMQLMVIARCLPFTHRVAAEYGRIRAGLQRRGMPIGALDMLIAAHAKSEGLTLITNNTREFERVEGLDLEDWAV